MDFSKLIIIMTSNIGAAKDASSIGFVESDETAQQRFMNAVRGFWRPEFFNRIDRVVPFRRLAREDLSKIADILLTKLLKRDGFSRRPVTVMGDRDALDWVVDRGYSEKLGGRAMRRAVERELVGPIANTMAGMLPDEMAIIRMRKEGNGLQTAVLPLHSDLTQQDHTAKAPTPEFSSANDQFYAAVDDYIEVMLQRCKSLPGADGFDDHTHPLAFERISTEDYLGRLRDKAEALSRYDDDSPKPRTVVRAPSKPADGSAKTKRGRASYRTPVSSPARRHHKDLHAFQDIDDYLYETDSYGSSPEASEIEIVDKDFAFQSLLHDLKHLPLLVPERDWRFQRVVLLTRTFNREGPVNRDLFIKAMGIVGLPRIDEGTDLFDEEDVDQGLRIERLKKKSSWEKEVQQTMEKFRKIVDPVQLRKLQNKPAGIVADELLIDNVDGVIVSGNNALAWVAPLVGTHITKLISRSIPIQVIAREIPDGQTCEETLTNILQEHRQYENARMDDPRDPFHLRPLGVNLFGNKIAEFARQVSDHIANRMALPTELQEAWNAAAFDSPNQEKT